MRVESEGETSTFNEQVMASETGLTRPLEPPTAADTIAAIGCFRTELVSFEIDLFDSPEVGRCSQILCRPYGFSGLLKRAKVQRW